VTARFCDETDFGFGWIRDEFLARCSHALVADRRVWLVDPLDGEGVDERVRDAGEPAGVIQLLDRHARDCAAFADRFRVPHHVVPRMPIPGAPFELRVVRDRRSWREVALWWPGPRLLVCADVLGTATYFVARGERLGVHPLLRAMPPRDAFRCLSPGHVLCGHGEGVHEGASDALREALATARTRLPRLMVSALRRRR
jgi:hypothetical protein